ncbi:plant UBX domain-containing protein 10-like [Primulina eburnea]|uniref:plant UBX domain-containing protein 10-like n=1 Tax=Primulina eburnea TaxID=1245227 RepID=UPI003C6C139D
MGDVSDKLAYFQAITGIDDTDLCTEILTAHGWDLELAISSITATEDHRPFAPDVTDTAVSPTTTADRESQDIGLVLPPSGNNNRPPGLAWKLITLPFSIVSSSLGLISGAIGFGIWAAGGVLSYSLGTIGLYVPARLGSAPPVSVSQSAAEAVDFVSRFERSYGSARPNFLADSFMDALQRSRQEYKLLFVYLHSPDHQDTPVFCENTLCNDVFVAFVNENFVAWGGSVKASEGFKMSNSLKASRFPFCAVVMAATNQRIALLQQIEGPKSPEEMVTMLQRVLEESASVLVSARLEAEERINNMRLREEQDAAYRAALETDQARERQRKEELEKLERETAEAERKRKEEEVAREKTLQEAAAKEAALAKMREDKCLSLGAEPEKGPDVTQVLVRFPSGERKDRRFHCTSTIQSLYDYVDSLGCLEVDSYRLVSNFPRIVYGPEKLALSLKEAGLHPQASLFVELN